MSKKLLLILGGQLWLHFAALGAERALVLIEGRAAHPTRLLAKERAGRPGPDREVFLQNLNLQPGRRFSSMPGLVVLDAAGAAPVGGPARKNLADPREDLLRRIEVLRQSGFYEYVQPDYLIKKSALPADEKFADGTLWGLRNTGQNEGVEGADIGAVAAWDLTTGSTNVLVALIDSGLRYTHRELEAQMWRNPDEVAGNNLDDDQDGYIDNVFGINAVTGSGDPVDDDGHGTHLAGIIGAAANDGHPIVGVSWQVRLMACKFLETDGFGSTSDAVRCFDFALKEGAKILNTSWALEGINQALFDAVSAARNRGALVIAAAGNESLDTDRAPQSPASFQLDNVISVAALDRADRLAPFSNFGATTVHLAAPGVGIYSSWRRSDLDYEVEDGSSQAAAYVSGVAALVQAHYPGIPLSELRERLLRSAVPVESVRNKTVTGGRINALNALNLNLAPGSRIWEFSSGGAAFSAPITVTGAGTILAGADNGKLYAVNPDGTAKWTFQTGKPIRSAPMIGTDGTIYLGSLDGNLYALNSDGSLKWQHTSTYDNTAYLTALGADGRIYANFRGLNAFLPTGQLAWQLPLINLASVPVIGADGMIYVAAEKMTAIRPTGEIHWTMELERPLGFRGQFLAIDTTGVLYAEANWSMDFRLHAINPDGTIRWNYQGLDGRVVGAPVAGAGGKVFVGTDAGSLYVFESNGILQQRKTLTTTAGVSPVATSNGLLVVAYGAGKVLGLDAQLEISWTTEIGGWLSLPAVSPAGTVYVGSTIGKLFALRGTGGLASAPWPITGANLQHTGRTEATASPGVPDSVSASQGLYAGKVLVEWRSAAQATSYQLWRATSTNSSTATLLKEGITGATHFFDQTAQNETTYWYWVKSVNLTGASSFSAGVRGSAAASGTNMPWALDLGRTIDFSSPAMSTNGTIYISTTGEANPLSGAILGMGKVFAIGSNGVKQWELELGNHGYGSPVVGSDGTIYIGIGFNSWESSGKENVLGYFYALQPNGTKKWQFPSPRRFVSAAALGSEGTIYIPSMDGNLYALNPNGTSKWHFTTGGPIHFHPAVAADGTIYLGSTDEHLYALTPTGQSKWSFRGGYMGAPAIGSDGTIYAGGGSPNSAGHREYRLHAVNPDGSLNWSFPAGGPLAAAPAIDADGRIYFGSADGRLYALNRDGTLAWTFETQGATHFTTPAIAADGAICFASLDQRVRVMNPDGSIRLSFLTEGPVLTSPLIATNGRIYFGSTDGKLYSIAGQSRLASDRWPMFGRDPQHTGRDPTSTLPIAPSNLTASKVLTNGIALSWSALPGLPSYEVWRHTTNDVRMATRIAAFLSGSTQFVDTTASAGTTFFYWIRARNSLGLGPFSVADSGFRPLPPVGGMIWSFPVGVEVHGSPAVAPDGTIYVGSSQLQNWNDSEHHFYAFHANGTLKWKHPMGNRVFSSPAIAADGTVYVGCNDFKVYAFHPDGSLRWTYINTLRRFGAFLSSPAISQDGTIYIGSNDNLLHAIRPDGTLKWSYATAPEHTASPVNTSPAIGGDGTVYVGAGNTLFAISQEGTLVWSVPLDQSFDSSPTLGPDGTIYVGTAHPFNFGKQPGSLYAIRPDGTIRWRFSAGPIRSSPVLGPGGTIYFGDDNHKFYALREDGTPQWIFEAGSVIQSTAALAHDGTIYFGSKAGKLFALSAGGTKLWEFSTGGPVYSSPAIGQDGTVYFGSNDGRLYFVRGSSPLAEAPWPKFRRDQQHHARSPVIPPVPERPTGVSATKGALLGTVRINWQNVPWAVSYEVWRSTGDSLSQATRLAEKISTRANFDDTSAQFEVNYRYWVKAVNASGASAPSEPDTGYQDFKKWDFSAEGSISTSPALSPDGIIYFGTLGFEGKLYALDRTGRKLWEFVAGGSIASSPALAADGTIYFGSDDRKLYALNPDGSLKWAFLTGSWINSSPAVGGDGTVYVGSNDRSLYAFRPDGTKLWQLSNLAQVYSSPAIGPDGVIYFGTQGIDSFAVYPNGTIKWKARMFSAVGSSPAIDPNGVIYFRAWNGKVAAWSFEGVKRWEFDTPHMFHTSPSIGPDGTIYIGAGDNFLRALNPEGTLRWEKELDKIVAAPAIGADGSIIVGADNSKVYCLGPDGSVRWEFAAEGGIADSSPALDSDGTIYVGSVAGKLYALKGTTPLAQGRWPRFGYDLRQTANLSPVPSPPSVPTGLAASQGAFLRSVRLSWNPETGPSTFEIWRNASSDLSSATLIAENLIGVAQHDDRSALPGLTNFYWMRTRNIQGFSPFTSPVMGFATLEGGTREWTLDSAISAPLALSKEGTVYAGTQSGKLHAVSADGAIAWVYDAGTRILHTPVVASDGTIYLRIAGKLLALGSDGKQKWRSERPINEGTDPALGSDGTIYLRGADNSLSALDANGQLQWSYPNSFPMQPSPVVGSDGSIYYVTTDGFLHALNRDGTLFWKTRLSPHLMNSPVLGPAGTIYAGSVNRIFYAVNPDGAVKWEFPTEGGADGHAAIGPEGTIYFGMQGSVRRANATHQLAYPVLALNPDGTQRWEYLAKTRVPGFAVDGAGHIYFGDADGLVALFPNGTRKWTFLTDVKPVGIPLIDHQGTLYFSLTNRLYGIQIGSPPPEGLWSLHRGDAQHAARAPQKLDLPVRITRQPEPKATRRGSAATFEVSVLGTPPMAFQWTYDGLAIPGATNALLSLTNLQYSQAGLYAVTITNQFGSARSAEALLEMIGHPEDEVEYAFSTLAGLAGLPGNANGAGPQARFNSPSGVAVDSSGNLYVADLLNGSVRKVSPEGLTTTVPGAVGLNYPTGIAVDDAGTVYVSEALAHTVRRIDSSGASAVLAGLSGSWGSADGTGALARFYSPAGLALDVIGGLWVADQSNHLIRRVTPVGTVTTIAGSAVEPGKVDGLGSAARFRTPTGLVLDRQGNLLITDSDNWAVRKMTPAGQVTTLGAHNSQIPISHPSGIALNSAGTVVITDSRNHTLVRWSPSGAQKVIGGSAFAAGSADGPGPSARFSAPVSAVFDRQGNLYVADKFNHTIRKGTPSSPPPEPPVITLHPQNQFVLAGGELVLSVTVSSVSPVVYQWRKNDTNLPGAIRRVLPLSAVRAEDQGVYSVVVSNSSGSVLSRAAEVTVASERPLELAIASVVAARGAVVPIPITVSGFSNITSLQFAIRWPTNLIAFESVEPSNLAGLSSGSFGLTETGQGILRVSWDDPSGQGQTLAESSILMRLQLRAIGDAGATAAINVGDSPIPAEASAAAGPQIKAVPVLARQGLLSIQNLPAVSGRIRYYSGDRSVPGVVLALSGSSTEPITTGSDGTFSLNVDGSASSTLTPSKSSETPPSQGVTTLDITLIRRHILGTAPLESGFQILAADVNESSSVTTLDITLIRRLILGLAQEYPGPLWRFVPTDSEAPTAAAPWARESARRYDRLEASVTGQDFWAVKLGDVNGSWTPPSGAPATSAHRTNAAPADPATDSTPARPVRFKMLHSAAERPGPRRVSVVVAGFERVTSAQFTVSWNSNDWEMESAGEGRLPGLNEENFYPLSKGAGKVAFSWDDPSGRGVNLAEGEPIFSLTFKSKSGNAAALKVRWDDFPVTREVSVQGKQAQALFEEPETVPIGPSGATVTVTVDPATGLAALSLATIPGRRYVIEFTDSLTNPVWTRLAELEGDGEPRIVRDSQNIRAARFYRVLSPR